MELNPTIWGTKEQQTRSISGFNIDTYSIASTTVTTASTLGNYKENHGTAEPIDQSINYWQLWDKSPFNKMLYIRKDGANNHIYTEVKSIRPKSIFVVLKPPQISDVNFDINSQYSHLWEPEIAYPNSRIPYGNNGDIVTKFNYNQLVARFTPVVYHRDENGYPTSGSVNDEFETIYGFFNLEEDGVPVREKYIITGLNVELFPITATGQSGYGQNYVFYFVSGTPIETPQPNYYYQGTDYITYTRGNSLIGGGISGNGGYGYQTGAYGQSSHAPFWGYDPDNHWELKNFINANNQYIEYFEFTGTYEDMLSQCASLGFWFKEDLKPGSTIPTAIDPILTGPNCTNERIIMPIIENGMTTGRYLRGREAGAHPQAQWGANWRENAGYDGDKPYKETDPNTYDEDQTTILRQPLYAQIGGHTYITTGTYFTGAWNTVQGNILAALDDLQDASDDLVVALDNWDGTVIEPPSVIKARAVVEASEVILEKEKKKRSGLHTNPVDCVKSILAFPFDLRTYIASEPSRSMVWGLYPVFPYDEPLVPYNLVQGTTSQFWVPGGECTYFAEYGNFLDYSPYCSAELYIPYCGSVNIDPETFIGHRLSVRYLVDWHTGACLALVYRDNLVVEQISGQMAVSIPMVAADSMSYANSLFQGQQTVKNAQTAAVATTVSGLTQGFTSGMKVGVAPTAGNIASGISSIVNNAAAINIAQNNVKSAEYELATKQLSYKQVTTATPMTSTANEQECRLVLYRPTFLEGYSKDNFGTYGHTTGFACLENKSLSGFSGLTVCSSSDLSGIGRATEAEKALIDKALRTGVYL